MDGIINIYKEKGYTSHDVVSVVKRLLRAKKVGHAGTLDPDATGVLIVLIGKCTKLSDYLMGGDKEYRATVKFGAVTTTYDASGEIISTGSVGFTENELSEAVSGFIGEQAQIPPMYSALKSGGKKLYDLARKGVEIEREPRKIVVSDIYVEQFNGSDEAVIYIKCGKGTYVRSICHDLGQKLGCGAYMAELSRTRSGGFSSDEAVTLGALKEVCEHGKLEDVIIPIERALEQYNRIVLPRRSEKLAYNGARLGRDLLRPGENIEALNVLVNENGDIIGIYEAAENEHCEPVLKPKTFMWSGGND